MTDNTEREWPTFGDILSELNTLGHLSQVPSTTAEVAPTIAEPTPIAPVAEAPVASAPAAVEPVPVETFDTLGSAAAPTAPAIDHDIVVPILPPSTFDTSLLAPSTDDTGVAAFDTSALEPLAPAPDVDALVASDDFAVDSAPTSEATDAGSVFDAPAFEPVEVEAPTIEPMAFEPVEVETPIIEPMAFEPVEVETPIIEPMAFEPVEVEPESVGFEPLVFDTPDFATEDAGMEWAETSFDGAIEQDPPFTGEAPGSVIAFEPDASAEPAPMLTPMSTEDFTSTAWSSGDDELVAEEPAAAENFDSVATADAIESDLQDLFALDQSVSEDNFGAFMSDATEVADDAPVADVVPLHPATENNEEVFGLDAVFDPAAPIEEEPIQAWVGIQEEEQDREDPWAYMRPDEAEDVKGGFWGNRPKFFGGAERKAKKAARQQAAAAQEMRADQAGPTCPNCNEIGQVDLDDPIGGKIHASCQNCGHVWSQASDAELRTESA